MACVDRSVISIFMFELFCTDGWYLLNTSNSFFFMLQFSQDCFSCYSPVRIVFHVTVQSGLSFMLQSIRIVFHVANLHPIRNVFHATVRSWLFFMLQFSRDCFSSHDCFFMLQFSQDCFSCYRPVRIVFHVIVQLGLFFQLWLFFMLQFSQDCFPCYSSVRIVFPVLKCVFGTLLAIIEYIVKTYLPCVTTDNR